ISPTKSASEGFDAVEGKRRSADAARKRKELELAGLLLGHPPLALNHAELVAGLPFQDPSLDRLRQELLNLAAAGSSLEKTPVLNHLLRLGMAELLTRLGVRQGSAEPAPEADPPDPETDARFLRAALDLRELAEWEPERARAFERLGHEASEEAWHDVKRFLRAPPK
ncbi:MAG TPA: hypothetical protein VG501_04890, partial [Rhizomicrobium sp.]|nr:hypothetical protein [Rhizomicrobium sp.]